MKNKINWFCLTGILALIFYLLHDIIGAMNYPNYDWLSQAVSDLTATNSKSYIIANGLSSIYGIFSCLCCTMVYISMKEESKKFKIGVFIYMIMCYVSAIGYSLFPLTGSGYDGTIQSFIHVYIITTIVVLSSIISLILIYLGAKNEHKIISRTAILSLLFMFLGSIGTAIVPKEYFGFIERFSTYSVVIFTAILGLYGFYKNDSNYKSCQ